MTEAEWLTCEDGRHLLNNPFETGRFPVSERKLRLAACASCRRVWERQTSPAAREFLTAIGLELLEAAERVADGCATAEDSARVNQMEWHPAVRPPLNFLGCLFHLRRSRPLYQARSFVGAIVRREGGSDEAVKAASRAEAAAQAVLVRDVIGNPFRPVTFDPSWRTPTAITLAGQMYGSRDFSAMPILADALQDAGCDCDVLDHCRGPGPHVRGCWVVDLVLGKA
jgi:hypothetical protein